MLLETQQAQAGYLAAFVAQQIIQSVGITISNLDLLLYVVSEDDNDLDLANKLRGWPLKDHPLVIAGDECFSDD